MYALKLRGARSTLLKCAGILRKSTAAAEPFLNGSSSSYIDEMYESWQQDPTSVHKVISCSQIY